MAWGFVKHITVFKPYLLEMTYLQYLGDVQLRHFHTFPNPWQSQPDSSPKNPQKTSARSRLRWSSLPRHRSHIAVAHGGVTTCDGSTIDLRDKFDWKTVTCFHGGNPTGIWLEAYFSQIFLRDIWCSHQNVYFTIVDGPIKVSISL